MPKYALMLIASIALSACQTNQTYSRIDGRSPTAMEIRKARLVCQPRAEAAGQAATAQSRHYFGAGDAIGSGIADGLKRAGIQTNTMASCMAEYGLVASH